ncbi:tetratricopeptide repeat protein [Nostoc sp. UHCC 0870]|uniref:tetratricopeptide repeat protein n=1 Tax=Nostoc sp. UHCC 0870 TaxID=2914041 RepID=UPI001EE0EE65|nr:tetratricopeptide repeat protein [Nostoc sp. UHCC 0870]UKO97452.1 tetratricopeptide repeat protein [Nostoc sp. UHCC 0870]
MNNESNFESTIKSLITTAVEKHQAGELEAAEIIYKQVLQIEVADTEADFKSQYYPIVIGNLANVYEKQSKLDVAIQLYQQALELKPDYGEMYYNLGNVFQQQGKLDRAVESYQQALKLKPNLFQAYHNLGNIFQQQGQLDIAVECYQQVLKIQPNYFQAYHNLGNIFQQQGKLDIAVECYQQAVNIRPNYFPSYHNLGGVFKLQGKLTAAVSAYQQAIKLQPNYPEAHYNLANAYYEQGNLEASLGSYQQALQINPHFAPAKFGTVIGQLPIIYSSVAEINIQRHHYQKHLQDLVASYKLADSLELAKNAAAVGSLQPFYLAYQCLNDRDLQKIYGELIVKIMASRYPQWSRPLDLPDLPSDGKIRIGFVSRFFYNHSNWKIPIKGWIENLDRSKFELFGYHTDAKRDQETLRAAAVFDQFTQEALSLEQWCELIQQDKLDVLIFPEFGMDSMTVKLGCLRLAPIQIASWGHPDTSGLPTIDYYLSSELMEPENAQDHYTEKLVKLPNLSIYYTPLEIEAETVTKQELGIGDGEIMFWCSQVLFKYLPQHDDVFARIAQDLVACKFVFIKYDRGEYVTEKFQQRLSQAFAAYGLDYQDYCIFLPRMNPHRFAGVAAIADVFLDSIGWSGCNSTLEAIAHNIPIITLPGELMRGRHTLAMLKKMGVEATIAATKDDYVEIALHLGRDARYRQEISQEIADNKYKLYHDFTPIRALEDFLWQICSTASRDNQHHPSLTNYAEVLEVQSLVNAAFETAKLGKLYAAASLYKQALQIQPHHIYAQVSLAKIYQEQDRLDEAIAAYQQVLALAPNRFVASMAHNNLGNAFQTQGNLEAAVKSYQKAIEIRPDSVDSYYNLGNTLSEKLELAAAIESYQKALDIRPDTVIAKFGICMGQLPIIYQDTAEVEMRRSNYQEHLQNLANYYQQASLEELKNASVAVGSLQPFYLAYQCLNDRPLQKIYGEMLVHIMSHCYPQWSQPLSVGELQPDEKIRIGFVSRFFYEHSNWKIPIKGWVEQLDRSEFELFAYHTDVKLDVNTTQAAKEFDKFIQGSRTFEAWCELIQKDKLHILIFPEFGMDPMTVKLGCLRLAPIQMTSWGHPDTSGLPTIDYYLSSELMEPENAQAHYTEKLVRLPNLSIYYTPLPIQVEKISRQNIGIADDEIMFWCCQSLYKYLPQHDDVFPRIAQGLPQSKFVFIEASQGKHITEVFRRRLSSAFEVLGLNYQDHCIFLSRMDSNVFSGTAAIADVFLDSLGWSGCNSTLESIIHNIPVVTMSGELMRGRHSLAILKMMGIEEAIASSKEEYVQIAIRLGREPEYRQYLSRLIAANKHKLYGDLTPVRALEDLFFQVVNKPRRFTAAQVGDVLRLAMEDHRSQRLAQAQQGYYQVLALQPNHPEALYGLGVLAQQTGNFLEAQRFLSISVQVQPDSIKAWFSLANLLQAQGQLLAAESAYRRAIALRPDTGILYNNLGFNLQQQGKWEEAIAAYRQALQLQPNCVEADVNLGNALHAQNQLSPDKQIHYAELNYKLGLNRKKAGDLQTATAYFQKTLALHSTHADAHKCLAEIYKNHQQIEELQVIYQ